MFSVEFPSAINTRRSLSLFPLSLMMMLAESSETVKGLLLKLLMVLEGDIVNSTGSSQLCTIVTTQSQNAHEISSVRWILSR